jgi:adenosylhomocysteine nucleosidase
MSGSGTADGGDPQAAAGRLAPAPVSVDVGIVAAMAIEVGFLTDRLSRVRKYSGPHHTVIEGECAGKLVALLVCGMGRAAARRGTEMLIAGHRPRWVFSAGFAGALDPAFKRNAVVAADEVLDRDGNRFTLAALPHTDGKALRARPGKLLTVDEIIRTAAEKAALRGQFAADIVDMESSAVAEVCSGRSIPLYSLRVVSDDAEVDLPPEIASLMTKSGSYRVGAALRAIWHRPSRIKEFWALHEQAQEAADRLADVTVKLIEQLG